jgi:hypothetical protein
MTFRFDATMNIEQINQLIGRHIGQHDVACPMCGPDRRTAVNRRRRVLRIWRLDENFASYHCARCGEGGHTLDRSAPPPDPAKFAAAREAAVELERTAAVERLNKVRWLWRQSKPAAGTIGETYLSQARGCGHRLPATVRFLPARDGHNAAMIAGFGLPDEPEPGHLELATGAHLTRLLPDGSGKAGTERDKIMIGRSIGSPIVIAPPNDLLGLAITEGIEDALSVHLATGLGAWAAGAASRLPALADVRSPITSNPPPSWSTMTPTGAAMLLRSPAGSSSAIWKFTWCCRRGLRHEGAGRKRRTPRGRRRRLARRHRRQHGISQASKWELEGQGAAGAHRPPLPVD